MMNLPNAFTLSRIVLSGLYLYFIFLDKPWGKLAALVAFILGAITDYWDGYFARKMGLVSNFGKLADPIADKFLTLSAFYSFVVLGLIAYYWVVIIAIREIYVTITRLFFPSQMPVDVRKSGKNKTFIQMAYIIFTLLYLVLAEFGLLYSSWTQAVEQAIRVGIIMVVILTLWSGMRLASKDKATETA